MERTTLEVRDRSGAICRAIGQRNGAQVSWFLYCQNNERIFGQGQITLAANGEQELRGIIQGPADNDFGIYHGRNYPPYIRTSAASDASRPCVLLDARVTSGGPSVYARRLAAGLRASGEVGIHVVERGYARPFSPWGRVAVATAAARGRADLAHGLHVEAPAGRRPAVVTIQDLIPLDYPATLPGRLARSAYRRALDGACRRASRIIVPGAATAQRLARHGVPADRVVVVPLAAGPAFQPSSPGERDAARRRFAGGQRYVVASSGRRPHKNLQGLVRAVAGLGDDVVVAMTGPAIDGAAGIEFTGHLADPDVAGLYAGAEAMVLPAFVEGFGLPAVEAWACGVPVVCGDGTGALACAPAAAVVVDVSRPEEITAGVRRVLDDDGLRLRLGQAGAAAVAPLTVEAMAHATLAVYRDVLSGP